MQPSPMTGRTSMVPTEYASVGARFGAFLIDGFIGSAFSIPGYAIVFGSAASGSAGALGFGVLVLLAGAVAYPILYCRRVGTRGQSWGHQACGVRVVDARTGGTIGGWRAFGRALMRGVAAIPCYLGLFWALWEPQKRGWHDMVAGTVVVPASGGNSAQAWSASTAAPSTQFGYQPPPPPPLLDQQPPPPSVFAPAPPAGAPFAAPPPPAPVPSAEDSPWAPRVVADDERTVARSSLTPPSAPSVVPTTSIFLAFDDGSHIVLDRTLIIGRDPSPSASDPGALLIAVDDPTMSVSKTHLAVGVEAGSAWVEDRHSTNGVMVTSDGETLKLVSGRRVRLAVGTTVQFGDKNIRITDGAR